MPRPALCDRGTFFHHPSFYFFLVVALTALVYIPGLSGPFMFDDTPNLLPLRRWAEGDTSWQEALFGNRSGLFGRPLSILSFMLDAKLFGVGAFSFKLTNLIVHLLCGTLIYMLLRKLLPRDTQLGPHAVPIALAIAGIWLLHPLQVSTVLYIVQRMAQLSTLFILLALFAFVIGRQALGEGRIRAGALWLFLAMPTATALGILCKENGALAPLLCAVLELGYFRPSGQTPRPRAVKAFFLFGLVLPLLATAAHFGWPLSRLTSSYSGRTFTLGERLLSEPRALLSYIGDLLLPHGPALGLYTDDFAVSHSLMDPPTTLLAILALVGLVGIAVASRHRAPAVFTGIMFYLAGHAMESTVFPLELYFEHRNYLPSIGIFLAVAGTLKWLADALSHNVKNSRSHTRLWVVGVVALCATLSVATSARAWVWQSWTTVVRQAVAQHPESTRAQLDNLSIVWNTGTTEQTRQLLDQLSHSDNPLTRRVALISTLWHECQTTHAVESRHIKDVSAIAGTKLQLGEMGAFQQVSDYLEKHECTGLTQIEFADMLRTIVDAAPQPQTNTAVWRTRFIAATLYLRGGDRLEAERQASLTWNTNVADPAVGTLLARIQIDNNDIAAARITQAQLHARTPHWDQSGHIVLAKIDAILKQIPVRLKSGNE